MALKEKFQKKNASISIVGLGYVGLPLAVSFAKNGFKVYGIDLIEEKVELLKNGKSYVLDVSDEELKEVIENGNFIPGTDYSVIKKSDAVNIAVPTPLRRSKDPDVSYINAAMDNIIPYLHKDLIIVLESTTYPGTTRELIADRIKDKGFEIGKDIMVAFSPERVDPGNPVYKTHNTPKVVGGCTKNCTETAVALYSNAIETVVPVNTPEEAEMVKLLENTFRAVNIGLVNELAVMCNRMEIDIWNVIDAAKTKPFGFMPFYPGPGIGGHCIPLDPMYLSWKAKMYDYYNRFIELASDVNANMPRFVVMKTMEILNKYKKSLNSSKILILGVAYKKDIDDTRESPAIEVIKLLKEYGANVDFSDPYVKECREQSLKNMKNISLTADNIKKYDCVILTTNHSSYDYRFIAENAKIIFDTRNGFKNFDKDNIVRL